MRDFFQRSHRLIDGIMRAQGASFAQTRVLAQVARAGSLRSTDLAVALGYASRTVTEAIDGLERNRLVRREVDRVDRRAKIISLTNAGEVVVKASEVAYTRFTKDVFGILSPEECGTMINIIGKLNRRLDELVD